MTSDCLEQLKRAIASSDQGAVRYGHLLGPDAVLINLLAWEELDGVARRAADTKRRGPVQALTLEWWSLLEDALFSIASLPDVSGFAVLEGPCVQVGAAGRGCPSTVLFAAHICEGSVRACVCVR